MGQLVNGKWHDEWDETKSTNGQYNRNPSSFRNWITKTGRAGPTGIGGFKAEANRYHLYVSLACPWTHRTVIYRKLKGLETIISMSVVNGCLGDEGWNFASGNQVIPDPILNANHLHEIYSASEPSFTGRVTVPVLWDKKTDQIVSNESLEIIRMFNSEFDDIGALEGNFTPPDLLDEINELNEFIYPRINNGVYRAGFATTQSAYNDAVQELFYGLDTIEKRLEDRRYLTGNRVTEADWRLFTTLIRFDSVYFGHFKCNLRQIVDYPNLWDYLKDLYQIPGVSETVALEHIKESYYASHKAINPTLIVPAGPALDFTQDHNREQKSSKL